MTSLGSLRIHPRNIATPTQNTTVIDSEQLATRLVRSRGAADDKEDPLALLRLASPHLSLDDISIDAQGRVVVEHEGFRTAMSEVMENLTPDAQSEENNGICGWGCDAK